MGNTAHIDCNVQLRMHLKCGVHKVLDAPKIIKSHIELKPKPH